MQSFTCLIVFCLNVQIVQNARILFFAFHDSGSHFISMSPLFTRLADAGHQIYLFDTIFNTTKFDHQHITQINVNVPREHTPPEFIWQHYVNALYMPETFSASDRIVVKPLMEQHQEKLDKLFKEKWDLIVADALFIPHGHAIALKLFEEQGVPYLLYETACQVEDWQMSIMAMSWSPVSKAYVYLDPSTTPNGHYNPQRFLERLLTFSSSFYETFHYYYMPVSTEYPNVEKLGVRNFKYSRVLNNAYGLFAERVDYMGWMMPISNQLIDVGANCRLKFETLPKQMKEFVEKPGSKGTIYIAFGSYANWSAALPNVIDSIHYTIKNLQEYQIIFSYNGDLNKMPSVKNLMLVKWAPQSAILTHPKTRLFVSHGGMKSVKEAVCSQVPLIALPLFAEQPYAANNVAKQKIGLVLHKHHVTGEQMLEQANKILNEPVYAENIRKFKRIYTDRVIPQMDLAQFHVERAIRSKHIHRFNKRQGAYLSWPEFLLLDILGWTLLAVLFCL